MLEQTGNFWDTPGNAYVITTNGTVNSQGRCVMGRGIALQAKNRFPGIDLQLGRLIKHHGNRVHYLGTWTRADGPIHTLFTFPVKREWSDDADVEIIKDSATRIILEVPPTFQRVIMVRPGCGNGGLHWDEVKPLLTPYLNNRFIIVENNA